METMTAIDWTTFVQKPNAHAGFGCRDVDLASGDVLANAILRNPRAARGVARGDEYVGEYRNHKHAIGNVWYRVDVLLVDAYSYSGTRQWLRSGEFETVEEALQHAKTLKNVERQIERVTYTGVFVGSDQAGYGCCENGYAIELVGQRRYNRKTRKWESSGVFA